jgi:probable F420-dependent oxidoreductase
VKYTCSIAFGQIDQLTELAKTAEDVGFDSIALPDSIFYFEKQSVDYPYTADGKRMFDEESPWVDPLILAGAMGAVTSKLRFYTNVMKLGSRNPLLLARQVGSVANLTNNRFGFGVGIGWAPEEFEWCGVPYAKRGKRVDEMIEIIKLVLAGGMVEFHGDFYDFDRLQMSPAPTEPVPFYVGGHTEVALRRAARVGDGWTSAMMTHAELAETIGKLDALYRQVRRGRPSRARRDRGHRLHHHPVDSGRPRDRRAAGQEEGLIEAVRRHLYPLGMASMTDSPAHLAGKRSRDAVGARDKDAWLAVFADDAIVEDPIGPSHFDPEGKGHRGRDAISAFWDRAIAPTDKIEFVFRDTYQCGDEEANVGHIVITAAGHQVTAEGVFTYKADSDGKLLALRAYWEVDQATASARKI